MPEDLSIRILNLKSTSFGKYSLSPHETVTSCPMNLDEGTYESTLLKGDILHCYQGLINQVIGTDKLVILISQCAPGKQRLQRPWFTTRRFLFIGIDIVRDYLQHCWKKPYQVPKHEWTSVPVSDICLHLWQRAKWLLKDGKTLILEKDSYPKTRPRPAHL